MSEVGEWAKNIENVSITGPADRREARLRATQRAHERWAAMDNPPIDPSDPGPYEGRNYDEEPEMADDDVLQGFIDEELAKERGA